MDGQAAWWKAPEVLFPYLIRVDGVPAGFSFVASGPYVDDEIDFVVYEFFVAHTWRGTDLAAWAAKEAIGRHRGRWEVCTWLTAPRARAFWRKTLPACASSPIEEAEGERSYGPRVIFRFANEA